MKEFSSTVYILWATSLVFHGIACWFVVKKNYFSQWKAFGYYLFFVGANSAVMLPMAFLANRQVYALTYDIGDFIEALLVSLVVLEILVHVLQPFESLPGRTVARFCFWAVLGISTAVVLSVVIPHSSYGSALLLYDIPLTLERTIFLADAAILWIILLQAKSLGITWKSSVAEIAIGFVLYLTVQSTSRFVMVVYDLPLARNIANEVAQFSYLIALGSWIWTMTHRDPLPPRPADEAVVKMQELAKQDYDAVPKERIFAAVGIRINKAEQAEDAEAGSVQPAETVLR
ncbi:MAG TPA: hypothetical protein VJV96_15160 [Candidatus Angelobacter sp.]|jgi:hypothetical protein|nr:hypothetical protein [Candidatus Angelobacter sp.]